MNQKQRMIDSHQHFWQLSRGDYGWLTPDLKPLYRDFFPQDLQHTLTKLGIDGTILVQAAPTLAETKFLLAIAEKTDFVLGVVGWVDMESNTAADVITHLARENRYFLGIRPMIQDIPDIHWMLQERMTPIFKTLAQLDLTFDALVLPKHLKNLRHLLEKHPHLKCVIDHGAKPAISDRAFEPWASDLAAIARNSNVYCKLSGLTTEAGKQWTPTDLNPYLDHLFACFGPRRILWGSDWPVLTMTTSYDQWYLLCREYVILHFPDDLANVFGGTAAHFYQKA